ncbi:MAG: glycoside hydrolase family 13 protein [Clostridia bacterium]|nr:glycoside hydrolase family 13 protein [Clostridia bacterium]
MLLKLHDELTANAEITLEKFIGTENASLRGAFSQSEKLTFRATCPRVMGVRDVALRIRRDGGDGWDISFDVKEFGVFELTLDLAGLGEGLYWYSLVFLRGRETLFTDSIDNVHFRLLTKEGASFRLLVYENSFTTPEWFHGGTMYQIFPDRFAKSEKSPRRPDAVYEEDWDAPISQYGAYPGADVKNNLFYGGDLYGISEKLDRLWELGVTVIYLNPIFKAYSNHKYDTGDYMTVDESFGGHEAFRELVAKARDRGMRVILDGVFNHTGEDSRYFDRYRRYGGGAYGNRNSLYRDWYCFGSNEDEYLSWWGIRILPKLNHRNRACRRYFTGETGVGAMYVREGIGGWRLDVADELSDDFLDEFRRSVKEQDPEAVIIGEVWENAADKIAYGRRRRYFRGRQLDSVMNYPFRSACIDFVKNGNSNALAHTLTEIYSSYPKCVCDSLMNILGTHDTDRILTVLGDESYAGLSNTQLSTHVMKAEEKEKAKRLLKVASTIQYTVYGVPSLYYGDEAGLEGGHDPFCRRTYPWGNEDEELLFHYKRLGSLRRDLPIFAKGDFKVIDSKEGYIIYERALEKERVTVLANSSEEAVSVPFVGRDVLTGKQFDGLLEGESAVVLWNS